MLGVWEKVERYFYSFSSSTLGRSDVPPEKLLVYTNSETPVVNMVKLKIIYLAET